MKKLKYLPIFAVLCMISLTSQAQSEIKALRLSKSAAASISNLSTEAFLLENNGILRPGKGYVITESATGFAFWNKKKKRPPKEDKPEKKGPVITLHCNGACDPCERVETRGNSGETIVSCQGCEGCAMYARVEKDKNVLQKLTPDGWRNFDDGPRN